MPAAIVLAAGEGRRMGGAKALLLVDGRPLVWWHVKRLSEAGCRHIVVVARPERAELISEQLDMFANVDVVAAATSSQAESVIAGLAYTRADTLFVTPVDVLPASRETLMNLASRLNEHVDAATPHVNGEGGHPVFIKRRSLQLLDAQSSLHELLKALGERRVRVAVEDVLCDFDTPEEFQRITNSPLPRGEGRNALTILRG
ncbi:MAG: nucleotidyltransferase family protein [Archangium sp.]